MIYYYENQITEPDITTLINLADYFNTSVDYLIGNTDNPQRPDSKTPYCICLASTNLKHSHLSINPPSFSKKEICSPYIASSSYILINYCRQAFIHKKKSTSSEMLQSRATRIRTLKWRSQSPLPYHLAIALYSLFACDKWYYIILSGKMQVLFFNFFCFQAGN